MARKVLWNVREGGWVVYLKGESDREEGGPDIVASSGDYNDEI